MSFTINYKGTDCRGTKFLYLCACGHEQEATHAARNAPLIQCEECNKGMSKKPTAPCLDADLHYSMHSSNIGVDFDG